MRRTWIAIAITLSLVASSVPHAAAQVAIGGDVVITASGGRLRGTVSEYEPGVRVTIVLPDGTSRTIEGSEIASVTFADAPATSGPTTAPAEVVVAPPPPIVVPMTAPEASVQVERWNEPRAYGGSLDGPWVNVARALTTRRPRGDVHFGVQLEVGMLLAMRDFLYNDAVLPIGGAFGFLDVTVGETGSLRVGALFDVAGEVAIDEYDDFNRTVFRTVGFGARLLGGHDLSDSVTLRAGVELEVVFAGGKPWFEAEGRIELVGRLLDARNLEIGGAITLGTTQNGRHGGVSMGLALPGATVFVGWVFE